MNKGLIHNYIKKDWCKKEAETIVLQILFIIIIPSLY